MKEKVVQVAKQVTHGFIRTAYESGQGDALMIAGFVLICAGMWIRSRMKEKA